MVITLTVLVSCERQEGTSGGGGQTDKPVVVCANYPLQYFAQRIGGEAIDAVLPVPAGTDPAFWEPSPDDIGLMQQAAVILLNGAGYEKWLPTISLPENRLVDSSVGFRDHYLEEGDGPTHQHGPGGEHSHGEIAFTTWLDLSQAIQQARAVERALSRVSPGRADQHRVNLASLTNELASLDRRLLAWGQSVRGQPLIGSHPVYQYFVRRYGLNLRSVHWEPHTEPDAAAWRELEVLLRQHPARVMSWEGTPLEATLNGLEQRGLASRVVSPCASIPAEGDFLSGMRRNLENLTGGDLDSK
jgi:zinc transport system substrate-binding protein